MKSFFTFIGLFVFLVACNSNGSKTITDNPDTISLTMSLPPDTVPVTGKPNTTSITEDQLLDSLRRISFVKESERYLDSLTNHKRGMAFIVDTVSNNEVTVRAGYNGNPTHFETYYIFTVNPQTFDIKVLETASGNQLTVSEYEKTQQ